MPRSLVKALAGNIDRSMNMLKEFINVCPDEIWGKKFGGWPIWQQVYHSLVAIDFFVLHVTATPSQKAAAPEIGNLSEQGTEVIPKEKMLEIWEIMHKTVEKYSAEFDDKMLIQVSVPFKEKMDKEVNHGAILSMIASHNMYHLGSCDAALREAGLKGVF